MKKIILSALALFAFGFANAQDTKEATGGNGFANGDTFISGSVGFSSAKQGDLKGNSFTISPKAGFFVSDNIVVGAQIGYTSTTEDTEDFDGITEVKTNELSVGAFARYYATPASDFSLFGELGVNYNTAKQEIEGTDNGKVNGFGIALRPGVSYFVSNHFALEATIGALSYETSKPDADGAESTNTFGLNVDLTNINLGLVYKF